MESLPARTAAFFGVLTFALAVGAGVVGLRTAEAQPTGEYPCYGMPPLYELAVDPALDFTGLELEKQTVPVADGDGLVDEVTISWEPHPAEAGLACVAVYRFDTEGNQVSAGTEVLLSEGQTSFTVSPITDTGGDTVCYRLYALSATSRSEPAERCTDIQYPRTPAPPHANPTLIAQTPTPTMTLVASPTPPPGPPDTGTGIIRDAGDLLWWVALGGLLILGAGGLLYSTRGYR